MSSSGGGSKRERSEDCGGRKGIRWDEQNLEENERIKKELNPRKIDEPKTPYLSPMDTDEEGDAGHRMRPLALDNPATAAVAAAAVAAAAEAGPALGNGTSDEAGTSGASGSRGRGRHVRIGGRAWSDSDRTVSPSPRHTDGGSGGSGRSPRFGDQYYGEHEGDDEEEEDGVVDPQRQEKRRRFKEARKQHYNMREQLARARELLQAAESEDSEDLTAAEREQQLGEPQLEQRPSGEDGTFSEGHMDADVESEQEGAAGSGAAVRQRGIAGAAAAVPAGSGAAAAAAGRGLVGHPLRSPDAHPLPSVAAHPLPSVAGHPLGLHALEGHPLGLHALEGHPLGLHALEGHPLASPSAHPLGSSPAAHPLPSPPGHPLAAGEAMSD